MDENITNIEKQKAVEFKIIDVKKKSYFQKDISELGLTKGDIKKGQVKIGSKVHVEKKTGTVSISLKVTFDTTKDEASFDLFGVESEHIFQIRNIDKFINKKIFNIPDELMIVFLNISISGTRGMLSALNNNPDYSKILLPLISPGDLLNKIKNAVKKVKAN